MRRVAITPPLPIVHSQAILYTIACTRKDGTRLLHSGSLRIAAKIEAIDPEEMAGRFRQFSEINERYQHRTKVFFLNGNKEGPYPVVGHSNSFI